MITVRLMFPGGAAADFKLPRVPMKGEYVVHANEGYKVGDVYFNTADSSARVFIEKPI